MRHRGLGWVLVVCCLLPGAASGQSRLSPRWEIPGFDFRVDGAFRKWARRVAAHRAELLARGRLAELNAPAAAAMAVPMEAAVSGTVHIPAVLFQFAAGTLPTAGRDTGSYTSVLFGASPPGGNPYTERTFYEQMSNGLLSIQGNALGYVTLDSGETHYAGKPGTCNGNPFGGSSCNGLFSNAAVASMQTALVEALRKVDSLVHPDWSVYDFDAATGFVNLVIFVQPAVDGACGPSSSNHLWSHRFSLVTVPNGFYTTKTPWPGHAGQFLKISDYTLQSGVGGNTACDGSSIMPIGTATHETGHAFGLPDLYDISGQSEGVGQWSLMGSGNYTAPYSPSRMDVWSLNQLGWITLVPIAGGGSHSFGPVPTSDSAFLLRPRGGNPRGEYFLLENRQATLADSAMIRIHCAVSGNPAGCGGGMLIWHIDSELAAQCGTLNSNCVNEGPPGSIHGVALVQADGAGNLDAMPGTANSNRGDAGDPFPGVTSTHTFGPPRAVLNAGGAFAGFTVDSITQVVPGGEMSFLVRFATLTTLTSNDLGATITLDGVPYHSVQILLDSGSTHTIAVADTQVRTDSLIRYVFQSWPDGGARQHTITATGATDSISALLARSFRVKVSVDTGGSITSDRDSALAGAYLAPGTPMTLVAHPHTGSFFLGWSGDTTASDTTLLITLTQPYRLTAQFSAPLTVAVVRQQAVQGVSTLTSAELAYLDRIGNRNSILGDVGDFLAWVRLTHAVPGPAGPAPASRRVAARGGRP